jgi:hypothetical protein
LGFIAYGAGYPVATIISSFTTVARRLHGLLNRFRTPNLDDRDSSGKSSTALAPSVRIDKRPER